MKKEGYKRTITFEKEKKHQVSSGSPGSWVDRVLPSYYTSRTFNKSKLI
jgi:hypothetical protein